MISDAQLNFIPLGGNLAIVGAAGVSFPSPGTIDLLGAGVGVAPPNIIGNVALFGSPDAMGVGGARPELAVSIGTAFATANGATLNAALQAAPDLGAAGNYQPGTWQTLGETGSLAIANLTAGQVIMRMPWLPPFPPGLRPRFLRLLFSPLPTAAGALTSFTAGTIASALVVAGRDDQFNKFAARNFAVS